MSHVIILSNKRSHAMMVMRTLSCNLHSQEQCLDILLKEDYYKKMYRNDVCDGGGIILCKILYYHIINPSW